jgi:hypothetical protein
MEKCLEKFRTWCNRNGLCLPGLVIMLFVAILGSSVASGSQTSRETIIEFCVIRSLAIKVVGMPHTECPWLVPRKDMVEVTEFSWDRSGFSHMSLDFTIRNNNDYAVKDITIYRYHRAPSGTVIDATRGPCTSELRHTELSLAATSRWALSTSKLSSPTAT